MRRNMRKTINEKIKIVELATSKRKIKLLSIQHGITTKTIKAWIEKYKKREFDPKDEKSRKDTSKSMQAVEKLFSRIVFIVTKADDPLKNGNGGVYRHLFKDTSTGYMFCGYSKEKTIAAAAYFYRSFSGLIKKAGYKPEKVMTNADIDEKDNIVEKMKLYDLKKYSSFSLKKNSYI